MWGCTRDGKLYICLIYMLYSHISRLGTAKYVDGCPKVVFEGFKEYDDALNKWRQAVMEGNVKRVFKE